MVAAGGLMLLRHADDFFSVGRRATVGSEHAAADLISHGDEAARALRPIEVLPTPHSVAPAPPAALQMPPRSIFVPNPAVGLVKPSTRRATKALANISASAIKLELGKLGAGFTEKQASEVIAFNLANAAQKLATTNPETIRFDLLSGNLIIAASHRWGRVSLGYGEVNVYKLASVTAAAVVACRSTQASSFQGCANKTIDGIGSLVTT